MNTETTTLSRSEARRLGRLADELAAELSDLELAGLDSRAAVVRAELETIRAKLQIAKEVGQREKLEQLDRQQLIERDHARAQEAQREAEERRRATLAWYRTYMTYRGNVIQSETETFRVAQADGIRKDDLLAVLDRVLRRRDGEICLAIPNSYLRRDYLKIDE